MDLSDNTLKIKSPYKFNASWLKDPSYLQLVSDYWKSNPIKDEEEFTAGFIRKLSELKRISRNWAHMKRINDDKILKGAEHAIAAFEDSSGATYLAPVDKELYSTLISTRSQILKEREESWCLRSRAIWLVEGDNNTKFYHKFANGRKAINTIWELQNAQGQMITEQQGLVSLANEHFKSIYKAPREANILEIMGVAEHFPRFVE